MKVSPDGFCSQAYHTTFCNVDHVLQETYVIFITYRPGKPIIYLQLFICSWIIKIGSFKLFRDDDKAAFMLESDWNLQMLLNTWSSLHSLGVQRWAW